MKSRFSRLAMFLLFFLQMSAEEQTSSLTCGRQSNDQSPWHVAVYHIGIPILGSRTSEQQVKTPQYKCGGTLINTDTVLTAAHCVRRYYQALDRENILVSLAKQNFSEPISSSSGFLKTINIFQHPNYSHIDLSNDIAIIKLSAEVTFDNHVQPVCLWDSNKTELSEVMGKFGTVVGWGKTDTGSLLPSFQRTVMPVVDPEACLESDRRIFGAFMSGNTFCAGFRNGRSSCITDTGGALTFEENGVSYIRGIVSLFKVDKAGEICDPNEYTLFTDVAQYLPWIAEAAAWKCEKRVSCDIFVDDDSTTTCRIHIDITLAERNCKVLMEEPSAQVVVVEITGNVETLPNVTVILDKFENLLWLVVEQEGESKFSIEREQLFPARRIETLDLVGNRIEEIAPDTFDDLSELECIFLRNNHLKVIHRDTFKELYKLRYVWLDSNYLQMLPEGLFRNNHDLKAASFYSNKLKIIATDFRGLSNLYKLYFEGNECINKDYISPKEGTSIPIMKIQIEIWNRCRG